MASTIKSGSNNDLYIQTDGVDRIVVDSNGNTSVTGNVGIGTASPTVPLHVTDSGTFIGGIESTTAYAYLGLRDLNSGGSMADPTVGVGAQTNDLAFRAGGAERVRIDANGYVTMPYQPSFRVRVSQGYSGDNIVITFADIQHNIGNHYSSASGTFTAPVSGSYFFGYQGISASASTTNEQNMILVLNGGVPICDSRGLGYSQSSIHIKTVIYLSANDTVLVKTGNGNTSTYNGGFHSQFFGYLIG